MSDILNRAWRVVEDTHPITRAAIQVVIDDYEMRISVLNSVLKGVRELHKAVNGPYDDLACKHCTDLVALDITSIDDILKEPVYIEYPCPTIKALDEE